MPARIREQAAHRIANLSRRPQDPVVVAVREHSAPAAPQLVEGPGDPDREALRTARQRGAVHRLDDEMQVVVQDCVMAEAEAAVPGCTGSASAAGGERRAQRGVFSALAQARQTLAQLDGDVHGEAGRERFALAMVDARLLTLGFATRTRTSTAVLARERQHVAVR